MRAVWFAAVGLTAAAPAGAAVVSGAPEAVSVTIYRDRTGDTIEITDPDAEAEGIALVTETRTVDLPAGRSRIAFRGVAEGMVPQTAKLKGLPSAVAEQNFDYDLLSPRSLFAKSVGRTVKLVRTNSVTGQVTEKDALIRSGPDGVVMEIDGRIEALHCAGWAERLVFDEVPAGLSDKPTLSLLADAPAAGRYQVKLSYLARGFDWSADYVARINPDGRTLDLSGWITLVNKSGADFSRAPVAVVAGKLNRVEDEDSYEQPEEEEEPEAVCWSWGSTGYPRWDQLPRAGVTRTEDLMNDDYATEVNELVVTGSRIEMRQLGDYKLYAVAEPTRIAPRQIKQVMLLEQKDVRFERVYFHEMENYGPTADEDEAAKIELRLQNDKASNLGLPLPAGFVAVTEDDGRGGAVLAGDDRIEDLAVGLPFQLELGTSPDVRVSAVTLRSTTGRNETWRQFATHEVTVINGKATPVTFEVRHMDVGDDFKVTANRGDIS